MLIFLVIVDYNGHEEKTESTETEASEEPRYDSLVPTVDLVADDGAHDYAAEHRPSGDRLRKVLGAAEPLLGLDEELAGPCVHED